MASETVYTATRTFDKLDGEHLLSVDVAAGTVVIEVEHGAGNWIVVKTYSADAAEIMNFGNNRTFRFTVSGGATFAL